MKSFFPRITRPSLSEEDLEFFHSLDQDTYGRELAEYVAEKLIRYPTKLNEGGYYVGSGGLHLSHRDYCGVGLYNQTITRIRLEYFLEDDYDPVWNSYCAYVRKRRQTIE